MRQICGECGGNLQVANLRGEVHSWKEYIDVPVTKDFMARKCEQCGDIVLNGTDAAALDGLLEAAVRAKTSEFIAALKAASLTTQREIAKKAGVSAEYLSELVGCRKTPSLSMFNLFKLLSLIPNALHSLECFDGKFVAGFVVARPDKFKYLRDDQVAQIEKTSKFRGIGC